jgi:cyanuric acid amidohydrolase
MSILLSEVLAMPRRIDVYRISMATPDDILGLAQLIDAGVVDRTNIIALLAKTESNSCVNDWTRGFTTLALKVFLAECLGMSRQDVGRRVAMIMSGGTEGVISPHMNVWSTSRAGRNIRGPTAVDPLPVIAHANP